jgi:hypothetical protein
MLQAAVILSMLMASSAHCEDSQAVARVHSALPTPAPEHPEEKKEVTTLEDENFRLPEFLDYMRFKKPTSKKEFAKYLPKGCRKYWEPVYRSRATKCASPENPRLIVWCSSDSTNFNIAIDGDVGTEATADCQKIEILDADEKGKGSSAEILFGFNEKIPRPGNILENQSRCTACHTPQLRRVADDYPHWPGFLQSIQKIIKKDSVEGDAHKALVKRMADTSSHYSEFYPFVEAAADVPDEEKEHFYSLRLGNAPEAEKKDLYESTPVSVLFNGLSRTHETQVANYLMHHPSFSSFKYALAASALECAELEKFLPFDLLESKGRESLAAVKAGLLKKIQSSGKRVKEEVSRYNSPIELSDIDVYDAEDLDQIAGLFFLGQFMGVNPAVFSTSVHANEFSLPTGSFNLLQYYFSPGYGELVEQNAEQQALSNRTKAQGKDRTTLCEELRTDSLKALATWKLPKPTEIIEQPELELKSPKPAIQTALAKCVACHSEYLHKAFKAPRIPFENEGSLRESIKADPGLAKRIQNRIHLNVFHEKKMPPNEGLTGSELRALEDFAQH